MKMYVWISPRVQAQEPAWRYREMVRDLAKEAAWLGSPEGQAAQLGKK